MLRASRRTGASADEEEKEAEAAVGKEPEACCETAGVEPPWCERKLWPALPVDFAGSVIDVLRASMDPAFLEGDSKRGNRHVVYAPVLLFNALAVAARTDAGPLGLVIAVILSVAGAVVSILMRRRSGHVRLDFVMSATLYLSHLQASWAIGTTESFPPIMQAVEVLGCFVCFLHCLLACGAHALAITVYVAAVFATCWLPPEIVPAMVFLSFSALSIHGFLQYAEYQTFLQRLQAQVQAQQLHKLEQEAAAERQQQITKCLGAVLKHLKVPLLLMKSDASCCSTDPQMASQVAEIFRARAADLWGIFVGLQDSVQAQLGPDFDAAQADSQHLDEGVKAALRPQPSQPLGLGAVRLEGPARQLPTLRARGEGASAPSASRSSSSRASTSIASSANGQPRRSRGPFRDLRCVRLHFDALDEGGRISAMTFRFSERLGKKRASIYELFPGRSEPFKHWVQAHINDSFVETSSEAGEMDLDTEFGRVTLALPPLRRLLEVVALPLGLMDTMPSFGSFLTFRGFADEGEDGAVGEDDRVLRAVVELSEFSQ